MTASRPARLIELPEVDSTNLHARRLIEAGETEPFSVRADVQLAGRGRLGRSWISPAGGVWLTVACPTARSPSESEPVPLLAALAAHATIEQLLPDAQRAELRIKWPNDILHAGRKLAGILCERVAKTGRAWTMVGIGLNADVDVESLGVTTRHPVSLRTLVERAQIDPSAIGHRLADALHGALAEFNAEGLPRGTMQALADRLAWIDQPVTLRRAGSAGGEPVITGTLAGVDARGRAVIRTDQGHKHVISGDLDEHTLRLEPAQQSDP
ncbi:MAG: biotin--[acetyl-CoA-carboxylase] ligase [Planctomycetota bacterium]